MLSGIKRLRGGDELGKSFNKKELKCSKLHFSSRFYGWAIIINTASRAVRQYGRR